MCMISIGPSVMFVNVYEVSKFVNVHLIITNTLAKTRKNTVI